MSEKGQDRIVELHRSQQTFFATGQTKSLDFRLEQLSRLKDAVKRYESRIMGAINADLKKSELDSYATEIGIVYSEITHIMKHLRSWAKPKRVKTPLTHFGAKSYIYSEPYGLSLIISPWNYPFQLAVAPLIGAIAAGNCAIIKPSELSPAVSQVLAEMIENTFPEEYIAVVQGDAEVSQALLRLKFDLVFFTGSVRVGQIVMEAASKHLTPVVLELGGKSPCIVHKDAKLELAAKRIVWGKFLNAGQTCIAPDYLMVHKEVKTELLKQMQEAIRELFGNSPLKNSNYTAIINDRHFQRLLAFLQDGEIVCGGHYDPEQLRIEPTIIDRVEWHHPVMQEEIFGPILPVFEYESIEDVIQTVTQRPKPLATYLFTESPEIEKRVINGISFGGGCVNDTIMHVASPNLPFGGVGNSGMGSYHGKMSFDIFSHKKSVLHQTTLFDLPVRYPTFKYAYKALRMFLK